MPLEGHWKRVQTPLRSVSRREARAIAIVAVLAAIALAIVSYAIVHGGSSRDEPACIRVTIASSTGGATLRACGEDAARWCRSMAARDDALARKVKSRCRRAGYR
jgi:hypothetical protein